MIEKDTTEWIAVISMSVVIALGTIIWGLLGVGSELSYILGLVVGLISVNIGYLITANKDNGEQKKKGKVK